MKSRRVLVTVMLLALVAVTTVAATANNLTHKATGFTFWVPDDWTTSESDGNLLAKDTNSNIAIAFMVPQAKDADGAVNELEAALKENYDDIKVEAGKETKINGLDAYVTNGVGTYKKSGQQQGFLIGFYTDNKGKYLTAFAAFTDQTKDEAMNTVVKILKSVSMQGS